MEKNNKKPLSIYLPGSSSLSSKDIALQKWIDDARIDLVTQLHSRDYYVEKTRGEDPWLKNMLQAAEKSDAFLFTPMTYLPDKHPHFQKEAAQRWFEFFSIITGVHVGSREKYGTTGIAKPCVVMDPDGQWKHAIGLLKDLHAKGMFSSEVEDIVHVVEGDPGKAHDYNHLNKKAVEALSEILAKGKGKPQKEVHSKYGPDHHFDPFRKEMTRHRFGIAVFGSATTPEATYTDATHDLAKMAGERGWRMVTGAGVDGCMGAADRGFEEGKNLFNQRYPDAKFKPSHVGVSTQPILRLEGPPKHLDQLVITSNIYDRMMVMIRGQKDIKNLKEFEKPGKHLSEAEREKLKHTLRVRDAVRVIFVAPGGTGTVHEFATLLQLATNGDMMTDRTIVLLNPPSHLDKSQGFWKPLIETAEKLGFASRFKVADTPEQAMAIADGEYKKWIERNPEYQNLPHPELNPTPQPEVETSSTLGQILEKFTGILTGTAKKTDYTPNEAKSFLEKIADLLGIKATIYVNGMKSGTRHKE